MSRRLLGQAIFLRHGQTEYTEVFPDITEEGIKTIKKSTELLRPFIEHYQNVIIIASPMARAQGSAAVIAKVLDYKNKIRLEPNIQGAIAKDRQKAKALFYEHVSNGGIRALSVAYGTDLRYEDGKIIEPRSEVRKRFFEYFAKLVRQLYVSPNLPLCLIHISHYEVMYHLVESLFNLDYKKDEPLLHGEIVAISIYDIEIENVVEIEVTFRGKTIKKKFFDYIDKEIR